MLYISKVCLCLLHLTWYCQCQFIVVRVENVICSLLPVCINSNLNTCRQATINKFQWPVSFCLEAVYSSCISWNEQGWCIEVFLTVALTLKCTWLNLISNLNHLSVLFLTITIFWALTSTVEVALWEENTVWRGNRCQHMTCN